MLNRESEKTKCFTTKNCKKLVWFVHGSNKKDPSKDTTSQEFVYFPFASLKFYVPYDYGLLYDEYFLKDSKFWNFKDCNDFLSRMLENICNDNPDLIIEKRPFLQFLQSKDTDLTIFTEEEKKIKLDIRLNYEKRLDELKDNINKFKITIQNFKTKKQEIIYNGKKKFEIAVSYIDNRIKELRDKKKELEIELQDLEKIIQNRIEKLARLKIERINETFMKYNADIFYKLFDIERRKETQLGNRIDKILNELKISKNDNPLNTNRIFDFDELNFESKEEEDEYILDNYSKYENFPFNKLMEILHPEENELNEVSNNEEHKKHEDEFRKQILQLFYNEYPVLPLRPSTFSV
jgi:hypothetical protein